VRIPSTPQRRVGGHSVAVIFICALLLNGCGGSGEPLGHPSPTSAPPEATPTASEPPETSLTLFSLCDDYLKASPRAQRALGERESAGSPELTVSDALRLLDESCRGKEALTIAEARAEDAAEDDDDSGGPVTKEEGAWLAEGEELSKTLREMSAFLRETFEDEGTVRDILLGQADYSTREMVTAATRVLQLCIGGLDGLGPPPTPRLADVHAALTEACAQYKEGADYVDRAIAQQDRGLLSFGNFYFPRGEEALQLAETRARAIAPRNGSR
jgi:hypothetical protein